MNLHFSAILAGLGAWVIDVPPTEPVPGMPERDPVMVREPLRIGEIEQEFWTSDPWLELDLAQRRAIEATVRQQLVDALDLLGARADEESIVRTRYFLLGGDLTKDELTRIGTSLDGQMHRLLGRFGGSIDDEPFAGRVAVLLTGSRDRFELLEARAFDQFMPPSVTARLHADGRKLLITAEGTAPRGHLDHQLSRRMTHAWLHSLHAPRRLPDWANEGLATAVSWSAMPPATGLGRLEAIESVRKGHGLTELVVMDDSWSDQPTDEARAGLLMERLLLEHPDQLHDWILAVKSGGNWRTEFQRIFGRTPEELVAYVERWYQVND